MPVDTKNPSKFKDIIDYNPHFMLNISSNQRGLMSKHGLIVDLLKLSPRTVKEIHAHYADDESTKKTLKTIYRYIAELEEAGIVKNCGQRITKGSRIIEQVYCLSSHHFYFNEPSLEWWESKEAKEFTNKLSTVIASILGDDRFKVESSREIIHQLLKVEASVHYFNTLEIVQKIQRDPEVRALFTGHINEENQMIEFGARVLTYLRKFDEYKLLNSIIEP